LVKELRAEQLAWGNESVYKILVKKLKGRNNSETYG
jgi:hypothetical protein